MENKVVNYIDTDLITLAYNYLVLKRKTTHKEYTIADLFYICEKILQSAEKCNQHRRGLTFRFKDNHLEIYEKLI